MSCFVISDDDYHQGKYKMGQADHGTYGIFESDSGGIFRHSEENELRELLVNFQILSWKLRPFITMNNREASGVIIEAQKSWESERSETNSPDSIPLNGSVVLLTRNGSVLLENQEIIDQLESEIRTPVEIVERKGDTRTTFAQFFAPLDIVEIDQIFAPPEGDVELRITLRGNHEELKFPLGQLEKIAELMN